MILWLAKHREGTLSALHRNLRETLEREISIFRGHYRFFSIGGKIKITSLFLFQGK